MLSFTYTTVKVGGFRVKEVKELSMRLANIVGGLARDLSLSGDFVLRDYSQKLYADGFIGI